MVKIKLTEEQRLAKNATRRAKHAARMQDPVYKAKVRAQRRAQYAKKSKDPKFKAKKNAQQRAKYTKQSKDPAFMEHMRQKAAKQRENPAVREQNRIRDRERRAKRKNDPVAMEKIRAQQRANHHKKKHDPAYKSRRKAANARYYAKPENKANKVVYDRQWYQDNKERIKQRAPIVNARNRERYKNDLKYLARTKAQCRRYYLNNKQKKLWYKRLADFRGRKASEPGDDPEPGHVYFFKSITPNWFKLGKTGQKNPFSRLNQYQGPTRPDVILHLASARNVSYAEHLMKMFFREAGALQDNKKGEWIRMPKKHLNKINGKFYDLEP